VAEVVSGAAALNDKDFGSGNFYAALVRHATLEP
jgi:hypothetical protein